MSAINLIAQIPAREDTAAEVKRLLDAYAVHVLSMDGAERFEVYMDRDEPTRIVVLERYRDQAAFDEHIADPDNAVLNDRLALLTNGGSALQFLA